MSVWIWVLIGLGAVIFVVMIYGLLLPGKWKVETSILVPASPSQTWTYLNNIKNWEEWTIWNRESNEKFQFYYLGPESGEGAEQHWKARKRSGKTSITGGVPDERIDFRFLFGQDRHYMGGHLALQPEDGQTLVTWVMEGDAGPSPNRRIMVRLMQPYMQKDFERGLERLTNIAQNW